MANQTIEIKIVNITRRDLVKIFIDRAEIIVKSENNVAITLDGVRDHIIHLYQDSVHRHVFETAVWFKGHGKSLGVVDILSKDGRTYSGTIRYQEAV